MARQTEGKVAAWLRRGKPSATTDVCEVKTPLVVSRVDKVEAFLDDGNLLVEMRFLESTYTSCPGRCRTESVRVQRNSRSERSQLSNSETPSSRRSNETRNFATREVRPNHRNEGRQLDGSPPRKQELAAEWARVVVEEGHVGLANNKA